MEKVAAATDYAYVIDVLSPDYWVTTMDVQRRLRRSYQGILDCLHAAEADGIVERKVIHEGHGARFLWRRR